MSEKRTLTQVHAGMPTSDGAGVQLTRMIGTPSLDMVDPFLMLDRMNNDDPDTYMAGFPDHPHRGFETVTIMFEGLVRHKDSVGNEGVLGPGDIQWMTAGKGIIHSEMPEMVEGRLRGFQLWVNLPAALKMTEPRYQDIPASDVPSAHVEGGVVRVFAGEYDGITGPARAHTPIRLLDVTLEPNADWTAMTDTGNGLFMCVHEGSITAADNLGRDYPAPAPSVAVFHGEGEVSVTAGPDGAQILYCEGKPINEPVARYGPFVMNTRQELEQAVRDFQSGALA